MIEIASPGTPQLSSLLPPRRRRSPNDAPGASREHGRRGKYDPIADREHSLATLYPLKSSLIIIPTARQKTPAIVRRVVTPEDGISSVFEIEFWEQLKTYAYVTRPAS